MPLLQKQRLFGCALTAALCISKELIGTRKPFQIKNTAPLSSTHRPFPRNQALDSKVLKPKLQPGVLLTAGTMKLVILARLCFPAFFSTGYFLMLMPIPELETFQEQVYKQSNSP